MFGMLHTVLAVTLLQGVGLNVLIDSTNLGIGKNFTYGIISSFHGHGIRRAKGPSGLGKWL